MWETKFSKFRMKNCVLPTGGLGSLLDIWIVREWIVPTIGMLGLYNFGKSIEKERFGNVRYY